MKWKEVFQLHRKINAVYFKDGKIKSMLFSLDQRRTRLNATDGKRLFFHFPDNPTTPEVDRLLRLLNIDDKFIVYKKKGPNQWDNIGEHICKSITKDKDSLGRDSIKVTVCSLIDYQ